MNSRLETFLAGVRVLDLSSYLPGPLATLLLADMGAEVIKIEPPDGDQMQHLGPRDTHGRAVFYQAVNAAKAVHRMDLKAPSKRDVLLRLVETADVLLEGFRPGVMTRLGLDYATLKAVNPRLVYVSLSGYGASGPKAPHAGHDANYLAANGILHRNGTEDPVFFDPPIADTTGSLFAVITIMGALRDRDASGEGCAIDLALADVTTPLQLFQVAGYGATGQVPGRRTTYLNGGAAYYQVYRTADDRHVALGAVEPKFWRAFCAACDRRDWIGRHVDPLPQRALIEELRSYFAGMSAAECAGRFGSPDCCLSPVLDLADAMEADYVERRGLVRRGPDGNLQTLFPAHVDGQAPSPRAPLRVVTDNECPAWESAGNVATEEH